MAGLLAVHRLPPGIRDTGFLLDSDDLCNSADDIAVEPEQKLVWHVRHGQSTGNLAIREAMAADEGTGATANQDRYQQSVEYIDTPLSDEGQLQATRAAQLVSA